MTLNIGHKDGGTVTAITAIEHGTYQGRAHWHFKGTVEWRDGSHRRSPGRVHDISPINLCIPENGDRTDIDRALAALAEYMRINGDWNEQGDWVPHKKSGSVEVTL
jgi:hypothetical protein